MRETASAVVAMYESDQKADEEHSTFKRHIKKAQFHPNPQVVRLMGVAPDIGDKRASALIGKFKTVYGVMSASPNELQQVDGIGKVMATKILQQVGRIDI